MKKLSINWNVKQFKKMVEKGTISFDYPIQREGSQWDEMQKSLLIHSLAIDFPVPALYSITEPIEVEEGKKPVNLYYILDGKQRLTSIQDFLNGHYMLHEDTPTAEVDGAEYEIAGKLFSELDEEVQDAILSFSLQIYKMDEITDEQIEDLFYRLNNGTPLSKQQKAKAKMGTEWAGKIQDLMTHEMMKEKASFSTLQIRKADHETAVLQTMMMLDSNFVWQNISSNEVFRYAQTFKADANKDALVQKLKETMDYLNIAFESKESVLLKKVHFPMTLQTAMQAMKMDIHPIRFSDWAEEFKKALKGKRGDDIIKTDYKSYSGAGSVKKEKANGRVDSMFEHLEAYFKQFPSTSTVDNARIEEMKEVEKEKAEQTA